MRPVHTIIALALIPWFAGTAGAVVVGGAGATNGKHKHMVHGQVVAVQMDAAKGTGTITVRVHHHNKGGAAAASVEKTFTISANTKVEMVSGKKGAVQQAASNMGAVQKGEHVLIFHNGTNATDVKIVHKGKATKKNV
jgi:hypothetical protein